MPKQLPAIRCNGLGIEVVRQRSLIMKPLPRLCFFSLLLIECANGENRNTKQKMIQPTKLLLSFFMLFFTLFTMAQSELKKNDIYLELGGNGIFASLNYERQLSKYPRFGFRMGAGIVPLVGVSIPAGINYLIKTTNDNSYIETGFGITCILNNDDKSGKIEKVNFIPSIGYRHHTKKNTLFRINFTPIFNNYTTIPLIGISFGKRF